MYLKKKLSSCWQLCINLLLPSLAVTSNRILRSKWSLWAQKAKKPIVRCLWKWQTLRVYLPEHQGDWQIQLQPISPPCTVTSHPLYTNFKGPCKESFTLVLYMGKQEVLKARRRWNSSWADAQPTGTPGRSSHALTAPARRHLLMLQQVFEVNHLHNDLDVLLGSRAEVMLQVALPL